MAKRKKAKQAPADGTAEHPRAKRIPKELQNVLDTIAGLAKEPLAREIVIAAAGAALAARKDARKAAKKAVREAGDAIGDSPAAAGWVGAAVTAAAVEAGRRLLQAYDAKNGKEGAASTGAGSKGLPSKAGKIRKVLKAADKGLSAIAP